MSKEENLIFEMYKDKPLNSSSQFRDKVIKFNLENVSDLYAKISKYQVSKYGETLSSRIYGYDTQEIQKQKKAAYHKKYYRKNKEWISEKDKERYKENK